MASETVDAARMSIARGAIRRPVAVWLAILFCLLGGLWGLANVGRLEDPSFTLKTALVFVPYPGATAEEALRAAGIDPKQRGEKLAVADFVRLAGLQ